MARVCYLCVITFFMMSAGLAQNINGKWTGQMSSPNGAVDLTFNFMIRGDSVNGTVVSPMGELPMSHGKISGKIFSFEVNAGDFTIYHHCTMMSDSIYMKVPGFQGGDSTVIILKRVNEVNKESK